MRGLTCFAIIAGELFAGVTMLAAYQAWIQPGAPRFHTQVPAVSTVVVAQAPPIPSPVQVPQLQLAVVVTKRPVAVVAQPKPKAPANQPAPPHPSAQQQVMVAPPPAPIAIASSIPRQLAPATDPATFLQRGMAALNSRDFPVALTLLRQARQLQPANADLGYLMGLGLEGTGEFGAAIDAYRSCKSGPYQQIAHSHVMALVKKLGKQ